MAQQLQGITLIDLAGMGPSARCVRALSDLGARWIRLAPPSVAQRMTPDWHTYGALRGAEQLEFDLKNPRAKDFYLRLIGKADIVVEGFRPGVADRLGIGYKALSAVNPRIIYVAATGFGQTGPLANEVGHDINYQALTGALALCGVTADGIPAMPGATYADSAGGGWHGAMLVMAAIIERARTGRGQLVDLSAAEGMLQLMSLAFDERLGTGRSPADSVQNGKYACNNIYGTADGKAVAIGAFEPKFFANVCKVLGLEDKIALQYKFEAQPQLLAALTAVFKTRTRDEWVKRFAGVEACFTPVLSIDEVLQVPQFKERGLWVEYDHPQAGHVKQLGPLGGGDKRGPAPDATKSAYREVLSSVGFTSAEIDDLQASGVVG